MSPSNSLADEIQRAVEHHQAGRLTEANAIYETVLRNDPEHFDALYLSGVAAHQSDRHGQAIELISRALAINPRHADAHNHLGDVYLALEDATRARACYEFATLIDANHVAANNGLGVTLQMQGRVVDAAVCFRRSVILAPHWAVPHFNLGLSLREQGDSPAAACEFREAWVRDPEMSGAGRLCVDSTAEWARMDPDYRGAAILNAGDSPASVSIIFCSIDDAKHTRTIALYRRLFAELPHEIISIRDAESLAEAYNRGVASSAGDIILLSHDDLEILAPDFAFRLHETLRRFDAVGVMVATDLSGPTWAWSRHPHLRGWVTHHAPHEKVWHAAVVDPRANAGDIVVLDGVLMAARREVFTAVPFDDDTFDGFHLYDVDWSYRAARAGYRLGVAGDLGVVHSSRGSFDADWAEYADRFCAKFSIDELPPPPPPQLIEAQFVSADEVCAFFWRLAQMSARTNGVAP